jgi:hypothetical protein
MKIDELKEDQMKYYQLSEYNPVKFNKKNIEYDLFIPQICFIIHYLIQKGYTLSHICLHDFEMSDNILFLKNDRHIEKMDSNQTYLFKHPSKESGICFIPKNLQNGQRGSIRDTYASVALFIYYLFYKKVVQELSEKDYIKLKGTKPYYFIKNAMSTTPSLIYL